MAGSERQRRLDLDADPVERHAAAVVRAVNHEAAGLDRLESGKAFADPILCGDMRETQCVGGRGSRGDRRQFAQRVLVRGCVKIGFDTPMPTAGIHQGDGHIIGVKALDHEVSEAARGLFIGFEPGNGSARAGMNFGNH